MQHIQQFWQRLTAATPPFFKRLQVFGISLAGLGTSLTKVTGIAPKLTTSLIAIGTTITIVSQFAIKQCEPLNNKTNDDTK